MSRVINLKLSIEGWGYNYLIMSFWIVIPIFASLLIVLWPLSLASSSYSLPPSLYASLSPVSFIMLAFL
jgi:hypothetical protein